MGKRSRGFVPLHLRRSQSRIHTCMVAGAIVAFWAVGMVFYELFIDVAPPPEEVSELVSADWELMGMEMEHPCLRLDRWGVGTYVCSEASRGSLPGLTDESNQRPGPKIAQPCAVLDFGNDADLSFAEAAARAGCAVFAFRPNAGCTCAGAGCVDSEADVDRVFNTYPRTIRAVPGTMSARGIECADGSSLYLDSGVTGSVEVIAEGIKSEDTLGTRPVRSLRRWASALGLKRIDVLRVHVGGRGAPWGILDALVRDQFDVEVEQLVLESNFADVVNGKVPKARFFKQAATLRRLQDSGRFQLVHRSESQDADVAKLGRHWRRSTYHLAYTVTNKWRDQHS